MKNMRVIVLVMIVLLAVTALLAVLPLGAQDDDMEMPEALAFLTEAFYGDTTGFEEYIHPDWQWIGNGELQFEGHEGFQTAIGFWSVVFPDIEVEVFDVLGEGDSWAIGWYVTGTNTVDFEPMGVVATGNSLEMYTNAFIYFEDGMIHECHLAWDWITWFDALGMPYGPATEEADE